MLPLLGRGAFSPTKRFCKDITLTIYPITESTDHQTKDPTFSSIQAAPDLLA